MISPIYYSNGENLVEKKGSFTNTQKIEEIQDIEIEVI